MEIRLQEIDVIVTDRDGKRVFGLTADDFELFEGRTRQTISNFSEYRSAATAPAAAATAAPATPAAVRAPHTMLVLIDSLPRGLARQIVFQNLDDLITKLMQQGDRVEVVFWVPGFERPASIVSSTDVPTVKRALRNLGELTVADPAEALAEAQRLEEEFMTDASAFAVAHEFPVDPAANADFAEFMKGASQSTSMKRKTTLMRQLVDRLAGRRGKKTFLYVSNSFVLPGGGPTLEKADRLHVLWMISNLTKAANAGGVTFYAVRPIMPEGDSLSALQSSRASFDASMDALRYLTESTGGLLDFGQKSVESIGTELAEDVESYYSLAYRAKTDGRDRERSITVKAKNPAYRVRTRQSLVEKSNETKARDTLLTRLFTNEGGRDLSLEIEEGQLTPQGRNRWIKQVVVKIPTGQLEFVGEGQQSVANVKLFITAANDITQGTGITEDTLRIVAKGDMSERYVTYNTTLLFDRRGSKVSIGILDQATGLVGVRTIDTRGQIH